MYTLCICCDCIPVILGYISPLAIHLARLVQNILYTRIRCLIQCLVKLVIGSVFQIKCLPLLLLYLNIIYEVCAINEERYGRKRRLF